MVSAMIRPCPLTLPHPACASTARKGTATGRLHRLVAVALLLLGLVTAVPAAAGTQTMPRLWNSTSRATAMSSAITASISAATATG